MDFISCSKKKKKLGVGGGGALKQKKEINNYFYHSKGKIKQDLKCPPTLRSGVIMASSSSPMTTSRYFEFSAPNAAELTD